MSDGDTTWNAAAPALATVASPATPRTGGTGADTVAATLVAHGVDRAFVFPGGTIAAVIDACGRHGLDVVCARHEQGAGYAALAAARLTGRPQVVLVSSGPGVTNVVTPVADAYFDSTPLVVLTGQVGTADMRGDRPVRQRGFQEVDTVALMRPVVKAALQPTSADALPAAMRDAFRIATEGRQGPVLVDLPMNVQRAPASGLVGVAGGRRRATRRPDPDRIAAAAQLLAEAERPVILAGQGVLLAGGQAELRAFSARNGGIPVAASLLGLGAVPTDGAHALGYVGHTGSRYANRAVHESDCLLVVGARLDVRQTGTQTDQFVPHGRVIRVDCDPVEMAHARVRVDLDVLADARLALRALDGALADRALPSWEAWRLQTDAWRKGLAFAWDRASARVKPQHVIEVANRLTAGSDVVVVTGVGSHQQWVARHFDFDFPRRVLLTSGGHGAMGFDLPAAIGAQLVRPRDRVLCFVGDGSLQINVQELQTAVDLRTPVVIVVLDNHRLGIVSQFQQLTWQSDPTTGRKANPDFAALARAYGIPAFTVDTPAAVEPMLARALAVDGPVLVHCVVDETEDVVPMLLAGQTMDRMWPDA